MQTFETAACDVVGTTIVVVTYLGHAAPPVLLPLGFLFLAATNALVANSMAGALANFGERAGAASALGGAILFGCGALGGVLVSAMHDGTVMPLAVVMMGCGTASFALQAVMLAGD